MSIMRIPLVFICIFLSACYETVQILDPSSNIDARAKFADGAFLLSSVTVTTPSETRTFARQQIKIYAQQHFAYGFFNKSTNSVDAGAGKTEWRDSKLFETPLVNHAGKVSSLRFELDIQVNDQGFDQSIDNMRSEEGLSYDLKETWQRLEGTGSDYDGLWQLRTHLIDGEQQVNPINEVKMIGGGHYIWFHHYALNDSQQSHFGYGELKDNATTKRSMLDVTLQSSYAERLGQIKTVVLSLDKDDRLTETFKGVTSMVTKTYFRL